MLGVIITPLWSVHWLQYLKIVSVVLQNSADIALQSVL